jgi:N-formylglutamate amidohydrolase
MTNPTLYFKRDGIEPLSVMSQSHSAFTVHPPIEVVRPEQPGTPLVFSSPHSGNVYPAAFVSASRLDPLMLRRSEDAFVDELFAAAPALGAPLLKARFPRALVDPNREPYELDPGMFAEDLPEYVNRSSPRVGAGLGTIARIVASGAEIYNGKLAFAEAEARIEQLYRPYHAALEALIDDAQSRTGHAWLIDCHSMPAIGGPMDRDPGKRRVDFVLGDAHGTSCAPWVIDWTDSFLRDLGYSVTRNDPFAGGFITRHYGRPGKGRHALQIEINRRLYMDEERIERGPAFAALSRHLTEFVQAAAEMAARKFAS